MIERSWAGRARTLALLAVVLAALATLATRDARLEPDASDTGSLDPPRLVVVGYDGRIAGTVTPNARVTAQLLADGAVRDEATTRADAAGEYSAELSYHSATTPGIHNGDLVRVTDHVSGEVIEQLVSVSGLLDEYTGVLVGSTLPDARLDIELFTHGDRSVRIGELRLRADDEGRFRTDLGSAFDHQPERQPDHPPWRGYQVDIEMRNQPGALVFRQIQTPNATIVSTRNQAGGGYFLPGDDVVFLLLDERRAIRDRQSAVVDGNGIPRAVFGVDVEDNDVFVVRYHDSTGARRSIELDPFQLDATADLEKGVIRGRTAPRAPVVIQYHGPSGLRSYWTSARPDGGFAVEVDDLEPDHMIIIWRVAEPRFTGIGVHQIEFRTPVVRVDASSGRVVAYGPHGHHEWNAGHFREEIRLAGRHGTTARDGGLITGFEDVRPGDHVVVQIGDLIQRAEVEP